MQLKILHIISSCTEGVAWQKSQAGGSLRGTDGQRNALSQRRLRRASPMRVLISVPAPCEQLWITPFMSRYCAAGGRAAHGTAHGDAQLPPNAQAAPRAARRRDVTPVEQTLASRKRRHPAAAR